MRAAVKILDAHRVRAVKFGAVGCLNTAVDFAVFSALLMSAEFGVVAANTCAYFVALLVSYFSNKCWTFDDRATGRDSIIRGAKFLSFNIVGLALANMTIWLLAFAMPAVAAKILATGVTMVWNYWTNNRFVFR